MKISELQPRQGKVDVDVTILELQTPRAIAKQGFNGKVQNAKIQDDSGTIILTLWNDDVEKYAVGDKLRITNGYVSEWQGELQLGAGKFGKVEKL